jgi:tetratricopeptide (TPR) repeat protein
MPLAPPTFATGADQPNPGVPPGPAGLTDSERQARYDAAFQKAMELLAERKYEDARSELESAKAMKDTEILQLALARTNALLEQEAAAEKTATDIQGVLDDGKADEAAKLAAEALQQFGETRSAESLIRLKKQADALVAVEITDRKTKLQRFQSEFETAKKDNNLRAAVLALEQRLQVEEDAGLRKDLDEIAAKLSRFDELRAQAAEMRKDSTQIDEAIEKLHEAQKLWDTIPLQQEIADLELALQNRRDRIAVAEFDLRGDVGIPQAGAFVADEILPAFKERYDLVDRSQIDKAADELKLSEVGLTEDELGRREVGKAVKARYLVVGSITPVSGITVQARLIDTETGLIVQTAKVVAANADELVQRLPQLAKLLQMSDDEKQAFEELHQKDAAPVTVAKPAADDPIPIPPDELPADAPLPLPLIPAQPVRPEFVDLRPEQFDQLPAPPGIGQIAILPVLPAARDAEFRRRAFFVSLEMGDNLFRRRRFRDALGHYEFCLNLVPWHAHVRQRVERCRLLVFAPPMVPILRPRLAVLDFLVVGDPAFVPRYLSWWTADHLVPHFSPPYDVVSRAEVYWWMGRLGITPRDVLFDPVARHYLGRALNVRYFLLGHIVQTASFDTTTYLVDAEFGYLASTARIHVRSPAELKFRLPELAWLTKLDPAERLRVEQDNLTWDKMLIEIRLHRQNARYALGIDLCRRALKIRANNVEVLVILQQLQQQHRLAELAAARADEAARRAAAHQQWQERQIALARATELARLQAERQAAARAEADRRRIAAQREQAFLTIVLQARGAVQRQQFQNGIVLFESALALRPNDEPTIRELALARARNEEAARANAMAAVALREKALREKREQELAAAQLQLETERKARAAADLAMRRGHQDRDQREYEKLLDLAQQHSAKQNYDQAVSAAQAAKKIRQTPEVERLLSQLLIDLARSNAEKRGAAAKAELEQQLAQEQQRRIAAERLAEENRKKYESLLAQAQQLLKQQQFEAAIEQYTAARNIQATDATLTGLKLAQSGLSKKREREAALAQENERLKQQNATLQKLLADAQAALTDKRYDQSIQLFRDARKIDPKNEIVLVGLTKAERARDQEAMLRRRQDDENSKKAMFQKLLASGKANLTAKPPQYEAAVLSLSEALKLYPNDPDAKAVYAEARSKIESNAAAKAEMERKADEYQKLMAEGRRAMSLKQFDKALASFRAANRLVPGDRAATQFAQDALAAKTETGLAAELARLKAALAAGKIDDATQAYRAAAAINAKDARVLQALADLRKAQDAEMTAKKAEEELAALLAKVRALVTAKRYDEAVSTAEQSVRLVPASKAARDLLAHATKLRDDAKSAMSTAAMQAQVNKLVEDAKSAILAKKLVDAERFLAQAAKLSPNDAGVVKTQAALKQAQNEMNAGEAEMKRRQQAFATAMTSARAALQAKQFEDALKSVAAALQQMPNDKDALALRTQIEDARKSNTAMEAKREFGRLMLQARTAFAGKKYDEALKLVQNALKLIPGDAEALKLQADINKAKMAPPMPPMPKQPPALYTKQMEAGAGLEAKQQYAQALTAYQAALRTVPGDDAASKKVAFCQSMADGQKALAAKKFAAAVKEFEDALKHYPNDANAKQLLQRAKSGK